MLLWFIHKHIILVVLQSTVCLIVLYPHNRAWNKLLEENNGREIICSYDEQRVI